MNSTSNELESNDILDFEDNTVNLDILMNADQDYWTTRLGDKKPTIDYALRMSGFTPAGFDFTTGGVLKNGDRNKCVFNQADQTWYSWSGDLPYNVIAGSVPAPVGDNGWKLWDKGSYAIAYEAISRTYATVGLTVKGLFSPRSVVNLPTDVLIDVVTGKGYSYTGTFPHTVGGGETPVSAGWKESLRTSGIRDFSNLGIINDGTDKTSEIITFLGTLSANHREVFTSGPNIVYNAILVINALPPGCVIVCNGSKVGNNTTGYYQKTFGILSKDITENDTVHVIESGHHPAQVLINDRTSNTQSANEGLVTSLYALGRVKGGSHRSVGIQQWRKGARNLWGWTIRKFAPWAAVSNKDRMYEQWKPGIAVQVGDYVVSTGGFYVADSSGTTGPNVPVHTSGSVTDGGVYWTRHSGHDQTILFLDELGRLGLNSQPSDSAHVSCEQAIDDVSSAYIGVLKATGISKNVLLKLIPTDASGTGVSLPVIRAIGDSGLVQLEGSATNPLIRFYDKYLELFSINKRSRTITTGTTPSIANNNSFTLNYSAPTNITDFTDGETDSEITLIFANSNVTLKQGANLRLSGSNDVTPTALSVITLRKIFAGGLTSAWVEVSRSIK